MGLAVAVGVRVKRISNVLRLGLGENSNARVRVRVRVRSRVWRTGRVGIVGHSAH